MKELIYTVIFFFPPAGRLRFNSFSVLPVYFKGFGVFFLPELARKFMDIWLFLLKINLPSDANPTYPYILHSRLKTGGKTF